MPALEFVLAGIPLHVSSGSATVIDLLAAYFRYYQPRLSETLQAPSSNSQTLQLTLELCETLPSREAALSPQAQLVSHTGEIQLWRDSSPRQGKLLSDRFYFDAGAAAFSLDLAARQITGYVTSAALAYPRILANTYLLFPLLLLLRAQGVYHLHAAAVRTPTGKLCLFPASSRSGKTTLTTALGLAGWHPLADDSVLLTADGERFQLTALRKEFHLDERLLCAWPELAGITVRHRYLGRACIEALEWFGTGTLAQQSFAHVDYVILPQRSAAGPGRLELLSNSEALLALAEQSVFLQLWRAHTERQFGALSKLVQPAACYRFHCGPEILADPAAAALGLRAIA